MVVVAELMRFHERHRGHGAVAIGVNFGETEPTAVPELIAQMGINYLAVHAGDTPILPFEPLEGLPSTFFVDPYGELAASHMGPANGEAIEDFLACEAQRSAQEAASCGAAREQARRVPETRKQHEPVRVAILFALEVVTTGR